MWTDPAGHVWTTGEVVTAANMNTYVKDNLLFLYGPPTFKAFHSIAQASANGAFTAVAFDSEYWDVGGMHSTVTNTTRGTVAVTGRYLIGGCLEWAINGAGIRLLVARMNGTLTLAEVQEPGPGGVFAVELALACEASCSTNDYVEICSWQNSGGALNINAVSAYSPVFSMSFLGAFS